MTHFPSNKTNWLKIINLIKFYNMHLFYSINEGWANVTERNGTRHKITDKSSYEEVETFLKRLNAKAA